MLSVVRRFSTKMASSRTFSGPTADFAAWLSRTDTFLLDCDGVLWRGHDGVPGVADTIAALKAAGKSVYFVTNNSTKTRADYVEKLKEAAGIAAEPSDIISSAYAAAVYCKKAGITKKVYVLGGSGLVSELYSVAGVQACLGHVEDWGKVFEFGTFHPETSLDPDVQAVVIGFDNRFSYYKLAMASTYLRYGKGGPDGGFVRFVATNRDASYPDTHIMCPGGGSLVQALITGSSRQPDVVAGKPSGELLDLIEAATGLERGRTCMVGDRLDTDILFGNSGGLASTLLVLTGVTAPADVDKLPEGDKHLPSYVVDSFGSLGPWVRAALSASPAAAAATATASAESSS